jgi:replicative superfamily II helicase
MVDFSKKLGSKNTEKKINPIEIYSSLDRTSDTGPLRPAQEAVLTEWFNIQRHEKDVILKLHTGQGKTLAGLLMLQSKLNEGKGPVLYLCPNKYLVDQTCEQAKKFGVKTCIVSETNQIPQEFWDSKSILVTNVKILFNGLSKFKIGNKCEEVNTILLDDSHSCIDAIQEAFTIKVMRTDSLYSEILTLFESDLEEQGVAKLEEIKNEEYDAFLPVPYWAWQDKVKETSALLVKYKNDLPSVKFGWELVKDILKDCQCIISGTHIEITPYLNPVEIFGTFDHAEHRILMSATTNNDSFFIKGLGLSIDKIRKPLIYKQEKWSGEKMILIPYLMHPDLTRTEIVNVFSKPNKARTYGVVALTPSFKASDYWKACGGIKAEGAVLGEILKQLKDGNFEHTIAIANRYDGIDLPDNSCRILLIDSKPFFNSLFDKYQENCRTESQVLDVKIAQKDEHGFARGVRGEKDYCVIIITSPDLINNFRNRKLKRFFSQQTNKQIEIGFEVAKYAVEEAKTGEGMPVLNGLINQCLSRDDGWKTFYNERMDSIVIEKTDNILLNILELEREAERNYLSGNISEATRLIQKLIDDFISPSNKEERGWYMQEMARFAYTESKKRSNEYQNDAHKLNRSLLKPKTGMVFEKLKINKSRVENIKTWLGNFETYEELDIRIVEITSDLSFGIDADKFENALFHLGKALGFGSERPDRDWKMGPDNLWHTGNKSYILFECKNEVKENRAEIMKKETGQMNNSCAWFRANYGGDEVKNIMIIPTKTVSSDTGFNEEVQIMQKKQLNNLKKNARAFFQEFKKFDLKGLTDDQINALLVTHQLQLENILNNYSEKVYQKVSR